MDVRLMAHTQLSTDFFNDNMGFFDSVMTESSSGLTCGDGELVTWLAIRNCYSSNRPSKILAAEGRKYFLKPDKNNPNQSDARRLIRSVHAQKHISTLEHISFTFIVEGISRSCLAQLTRHRTGFSFSVKGQRYVKFGSEDKTGGFEAVVPQTIKDDELATEIMNEAMESIQSWYDALRSLGIPSEDARAVLPNAAAVGLVVTANLSALLSFYHKRHAGSGAQKEITKLAEYFRIEVTDVEPWTADLFEAEIENR